MNTQKVKSTLHQLIPYFSHKYFKGISLFGTSFFYGTLFLFLLRTHQDLALNGLITMFLVEIFSATLKILYPKNRPIARKRDTLLEKYEAGSFPSIHSTRVAVLTTILFRLFSSDLFLIFIITIIATSVCYSRIYLKRHYLSDVAAGLALGFILSSIII